ALARLADDGLSIDRATIVGTDLRLVEKVAGRMTVARAAGYGTVAGAWLGALIAAFAAIFTATSVGSVLSMLFGGIILGALFGAHGDVVLQSADGTRFGAFHADPQAPSNRAIVILPDVRGLHSFYKELALRWAEAGLHAVAIDYFGRTAGIGARDEDFPFREHMEKLDVATVAQDAAAAVAWVRERRSEE